jgi:hypothetical protein
MGQNNWSGFAVGSTVHPKTKGIWMWKGDFFSDSQRALVLLDTEGTHNPEKGNASHDMSLFAISLLLSSVFVYNTKGTIDASSLDDLNYVTEITKFTSTDANKTDAYYRQDLSQHFPSFIWTLRCFKDNYSQTVLSFIITHIKHFCNVKAHKI